MNIIANKKFSRMRRAKKLRYKLRLLNTIRLVVHRTSRHIYAQIIDTDCCTVLASASTLDKNIRNMLISYTGNVQSAALVGKMIAKKAISKGISVVSFDRSGFKYHGRIKKLADSARQTGLKF